MKLSARQLKRLTELLAPYRTDPITKPTIELALRLVRSEVPA
ncbi:MAG: hypothetical protein ACTH5L_05945 [Halomonas sp.]|nr:MULTISPECIES: hypothetical protein [Halomonas]